MSLKHVGNTSLRRLITCIAVLFLALSSCSTCGTHNGSPSSNATPSPAVNVSPAPSQSACSPGPGCSTVLNQSGVAATGKVISAMQTASAFASSGTLSARETQYTMVILLPDMNKLVLIVNSPQLAFIPMPGQFIKIVAKPNNDSKQTFTALQPIEMATLQDFQTQLVEYQGIATMPVSCKTNCAGQPLTFDVDGLHFNFVLNAQTIILNNGTPVPTGTPVSIMAKQTIDVIVQFVKGTPPVVLQVANLAPA